MPVDPQQERFEALKILHTLWMADNNILNQKLAQYLTASRTRLPRGGVAKAHARSGDERAGR
jgi:hypothetical protein